MKRWSSFIGRRFGALLVIAEEAGRAARYRRWLCRCDCGREEEIAGHRLTRAKDQVTACSHCRAPTCRQCGQKMPRPTMARICSPECKRLHHNGLVREARARWSLDPEYVARRAAYDKARISASPDLQKSRRDAQKKYRQRRRDDPERNEIDRERDRAYYDHKRQDPAWLERQRDRNARRRGERDMALLQIDIAEMEKKG